MSVTRVQLIGNVSTGATFVGVVTASSFVGNLTGNATGLSGTPNVTVGVATATTLRVGTAVTISAGVVTASSFVGNLTGNATGLSGTPNVTVGVITSTSAVVGSGVTINSSGINMVGVITANDYDGNFILDSYLFN